VELRGDRTRPPRSRDEGARDMKFLNPIAWLRHRAEERDSRGPFDAADEELYTLLDEASKVSAT
jgi:hypothetical protein